MTKWVFAFGDGSAEGKAGMRNLLGGKGAGLAEMARLGLPVPPGFTITTEACAYVSAHGGNPAGLEAEVEAGIKRIEKTMDAGFGDPARPLLVSVRSGARASMPGMMDTVLNLGLNDTTVEGLAKASGNPRFAYDSYRRFIQMYSDVVLGLDRHPFEELIAEHKEDRDIENDPDLTADDWKHLIAIFKDIVVKGTGQPFPQDAKAQLWGAIGAVFRSWMNPRAMTYRRIHSIRESWGTAVNVQSMVFGNRGDDCATGVAFTRNPSTGENRFYGEFLLNAQGEDVVAGIRTPSPLTIAEKRISAVTLPSLEEVMPEAFAELSRVRTILETHYRDMQDLEFTIERGRLWMLQTRSGKRTVRAALKMAVDMVAEKRIDKREAIRRIDATQLEKLLHPSLDPKAPRTLLTRGLPASPGAAQGKAVFTAEDAEDMAQKGEKVILVRAETSPEDIGGMHAAQGILTARGGMTSHAAVVARGMGKPCVAGAGELRIDAKAKKFVVGTTTVNEGDIITIDGSAGEVMLGAVPTILPGVSGDFSTIMAWADEIRTLGVRANAETPTDAKVSRDFGAEGIGLARTEHMFFEPARIIHMREMILAGSEGERRKALAKLLPYQRRDFAELFTIMAGLPVTIRLLDPPLHEFLPHTGSEVEEVAKASGVEAASLRVRAELLREVNPMLGHRGCRLGITFPEIYEIQARAIFEAAAEIGKTGAHIAPEIMIPLVSIKPEFDRLADLIRKVAADVEKETGAKLDYTIGTMIELPRAALRAGEIAESADFFSFGTNDLTQTTFGLSRDDASNFLEAYREKGLIETDPFVSLDVDGVGELVTIAIERGRKTNPKLKLGICGEHGGDPASIWFCHKAGLDYVSCSPYRVPVAKLAAAQAALEMPVEVEA